MRTLLFSIALFICAKVSLAQFSGGAGTKSNPFQIGTVQQLGFVKHYPDKYFIQIADIDFAGTVYDEANGNGWTPIGTDYTVSFTGQFDGNGHTISNLYINNTEDYTGLFGHSDNGTFINISIIDCNVTGAYATGGLVGNIENGTVTNCTVSGVVKGTAYYTGGLIGNSRYSTVLLCSSTASVDGTDYTGGLIGENSWSSVKYCHATGNVKGTRDVGGLIGSQSYDSEVLYCYASGACEGEAAIGGLIGDNGNDITVRNCYATGSVTASSYHAGALVGEHNYGSVIENCYTTGNVSGHREVGGIIGTMHSNSSLHNCYAIGALHSDNIATGGVVGAYAYDLQAQGCYWNLETTGALERAGIDTAGTALTSLESKKQVSYAGWDFDNTWQIDEGNGFPEFQFPVGHIQNSVPVIQSVTNKTVAQSASFEISLTDINATDADGDDLYLSIGEGRNYTLEGSIVTLNGWYDRLIFIPLTVTDSIQTSEVAYMMVTVGDGVPLPDENGYPDNPIQISTYEQLKTAGNYLGAHYELTADIDASASKAEGGFTPIGKYNVPFHGEFEGNGFTIKNLYVNTEEWAGGLFGQLEYAKVHNLNIVDCDISAKDNTGGIAGIVGNSDIQYCSATGKVQSGQGVGVLIGQMYGNNLVFGCYASGMAQGGNWVGGLIGLSGESRISCCYASGVVKDGYEVGGLVGKTSETSISQSYASTYIGGTALTASHAFSPTNLNPDISSCYWNTDLSKDSELDNIKAATVSDLQSESFLGWYYSGIWTVTDGVTFPRLTGLYNKPVFTTYPTNTKLKEGEKFRFTATAVEMDGGLINYSLENAPGGMEISSEGLISWTAFGVGEKEDIVIVATDSKGHSTKQYFSLSVLNLKGKGTETEPFLISSYDDMQQMYLCPEAHFRLTQDIDARTYNWPADNFNVVGDRYKRFTGSFDGAGFTVTDLTAKYPEDFGVSVFSYASGAEIRDVTFANLKVEGNRGVGGLVANLDSSHISNCHITGATIKADPDNAYGTGGFVAYARYSSSITDCSFEGDITAYSEIGGIVGSVYDNCQFKRLATSGTITGTYKIGGIIGDLRGSTIYSNMDDCYSDAILSGKNNVGGIVGTTTSKGYVRNCYYAGTASITQTNYQHAGGIIGYDSNNIPVISSYYDPSGLAFNDSNLGTPKTQTELKQQATYVNWDFTNTWNITEDNSYPTLQPANVRPSAFSEIVKIGSGESFEYAYKSTDKDGSVLSCEKIAGVYNASVTFGACGFTYQTEASFTGTDTIRFYVLDDKGAESAPAQIIIYTLGDSDNDGVPDHEDAFPLNENNAKRWYVTEAGAGTKDGSSWDNASDNIQSAIDSLNGITDAEIWVAQGIYYPTKKNPTKTYNDDWYTNDRYKTFVVDHPVKLYGGFSGTESTLSDRNLSNYTSTLSGNIDGIEDVWTWNSTDKKFDVTGIDGNALRVVENRIAYGQTSLIDGFTISGGNAYVDENTYGSRGGGIFCRNGRIENCTLTHNFGKSQAGAMFADTNAVIINCSFIDNMATGNGAGIYGLHAKKIDNCLFKRNIGADYCNGAAVALYYNTVVSNSVFTQNVSSSSGGAIFGYQGPEFINCEIYNNYSGGYGGGAYSVESSYTNCLIYNNTGYYAGGMQTVNDTLINCLIANNTSTYFTGGMDMSKACYILNTVVWGNDVEGAKKQIEFRDSPVLDHCALEGGYIGVISTPGLLDLEASNTNNLGPQFTLPTTFSGYSEDPTKIADIESADWTVAEISPLVDAGTSSALLPEKDLNGIKRIQGAEVDISVYELSKNSVPEIQAQEVIVFDEDTEFELTLDHLTAFDGDGDDLTLVVIEADHSYFSVVGTTIIPYENVFGRFTLPIKVSDETDVSEFYNLEFEVLPVNDTPVIVSNPPLTVVEGETYTYKVEVEDVDGTDEIMYWLYDGPEGMILEMESQTITWTPTADSEIYNHITVVVDDEYETADTQKFVIEFIPNVIPVITGHVDISVREESSSSVRAGLLYIEDSDDSVFTFITPIPNGDDYLFKDGRLYPKASADSIIYFPVQVSDGKAVSEVFEMKINVRTVNDAPVLLRVKQNPTIRLGETLELTADYFLVDDPDNDNSELTVIVKSAVGLEYEGSSIICTTGVGAADFSVTVVITDGELSSGSYTFPVIYSADSDTDGDGVYDSEDKCPNTPPNTEIDANGCALSVEKDTDGDGVLDEVDECPNTPAGTAVSANGCSQLEDTDSDGVPNTDDDCPNTAIGVEVDERGCEVVKDSDGDGVADANDVCPNTTDGAIVDATGCELVVNEKPVVEDITLDILVADVVLIELEGTDTDGLVDSFRILSEPKFGIATIEQNQLTYVSTGSDGVENILYVGIDDKGAESEPATITIEIIQDTGNTPPEAYNVNATVNENERTKIAFDAVQVNDHIFLYEIVTEPLHGTVEVEANYVYYTPEFGYVGADSFDYRAIDSRRHSSNIATVSVEVVKPNQPPVVEEIQVFVEAGDSIEFDLGGIDPDGEIESYKIVSTPNDGVVTLEGSLCTYKSTHHDGKVYIDFVAIDDDGAESEPARVTIVVVVGSPGDSHKPRAMHLYPNVIENQTIKIPFDVLTYDDDYAYFQTTTPSHGSVEVEGDHVYYTPNLDFVGSDWFTYWVYDTRFEMSNMATVFIEVLEEDKETDTDADGIPDYLDLDDDNDGVADVRDDFPTDDTEWTDTDGDGTGNNADTDDDGDGTEDVADEFPLDKNESKDSDSDGTGDNADLDDDNDGVADTEDEFPLDSEEYVDTDSDGTGDNADTDDDGDGTEDITDAFPLDSNESSDNDGDGIGDNADTDDDNDGILDDKDSDPTIANNPVDTDGDGIPDTEDTDDDNDGVADELDSFPTNRYEIEDTDADGVGNNTDSDDDNDGVADIADRFPLDASEWEDTDADGMGDNADIDDDNDGVADADDAFPKNKFEWEDTDNDGLGNNRDTDDDNDGVTDVVDQFPTDQSEWADSDFDGIGNNTDEDDDNDGIADTDDENPFTPDSPVDSDGDGTPDSEDLDDDNDGIVDLNDAFPNNKYEWVDTDGDGIGNNADTDDDGDSVVDIVDAFPLDATETRDTDADGIGNNADTDDDNDGIADIDDANPLIPDSPVDSDADGIPDAEDSDDDNDGIADANDAFPYNKYEWEDTDSDGVGNNADIDDDGDSVIDIVDAFPLDASETTDTDGDGIGNNADTDDDNDGIADSEDSNPLTPDAPVDSDGDGTPDSEDLDDDNDGVADIDDAFPNNKYEWADTDSDGIGNNADIDDDGDSVIDLVDAFPLDATETTDTDGDGIGNNADTDDDNDGIADVADSNPLVPDAPVDSDGDGTPDSDDLDDDNDGIVDTEDAFPYNKAEHLDTDSDGIGNNADIDDDGDSVIDLVDAFPLDGTETIDTDGDGIGNNADTDDDGDGILDVDDDEPLTPFAGSALTLSNVEDTFVIKQGERFDQIDLNDYITSEYDPETIDWEADRYANLTVAVDKHGIVQLSVYDPMWFGREIVDFTVTDSDGNTATITITFTIEYVETAVDQVSKRVQLYPNPTNGFVNIAMEGTSVESLTIIDGYGRQVAQYIYQDNRSTVSIDLSGFVVGVYQVLIQTESALYNETLIIE